MRTLASLSLLTLALTFPAVSKADIISLHDDFSTTTAGYGRSGQLDSSFSALSGTNVDVLPVGGAYAFLCQSSACVDLGGTGGNSQGFLRSNDKFAAGTYLLTFNLTGPGRASRQASTTASTRVIFGDGYNQTFTYSDTTNTPAAVASTSVLVTLSTAGYLTFDDLTSGSQGDILNSVDVTKTPEPSSLLLLSTGALGMAGALRRKLSARA